MRGWFLVPYLVRVDTMFSYTIVLLSICSISPAVMEILSAFEPLVATFFAVTLLGTRLTGAAVVGSLLILLTTLLQSIPSNYYQRIFFLTGKHKTKTK